MRRYDEGCTLAAKLGRGELTRGEVVALGRVLASFHGRARPVTTRGVPALTVERRMTENFHELLAIIEQRAEVSWVLELERFAHAFVAAHWQMLDRRARHGSVREGHGGIHPRQRAADSAYSAEFNRLTYSELGRRARSATAACGGVIVDATFRHRADRQAFAEAFGDAAPVLFVECHAPARVLAERAAQRERQPARISDASLSAVLRESSAWDPLDELPPETHVTVRSDRPAEAQLEDLRALLGRRMGRLTPPRVMEMSKSPAIALK